MHVDKQYAVRAFALGARGYATKDVDRHELLKSFHTVLRGGHYISPSLSGISLDKLVAADQSPEFLSSRERAVLIALAGGSRIRDIAAQMGLSEKTVSTYRRRIRDKLHLDSTADIVRYVHNHKLT